MSKITKLEVFILPLAVRAVRAHGIGEVSGAVDTVLLRLEDEGGLVGWGEAAPWAVFTGTAEAAFAALDRYLRPHVLGVDPRDIAGIMATADRVLTGHPEAKAALETALLDLVGRQSGVPVWQLLGGRCRTEIPLSVSVADPDWDRDGAFVERMVEEEGIRILKFKTGLADHAFALMRVEEVRTRWPDLDLRIDYNQGMHPGDALRRLRDFDGMGLGFIEQPVPARQWECMAALTAALDTPILADESVFTPEDMIRAVPTGIARSVSVKIMKCGGPRTGITIARMAEAAGWHGYGGDMFETGIAHLAGTHMIAAAPGIGLGCEFYHARHHLERDTLAESFPDHDGIVHVPDGPGLGMEVDEEFIRHGARVTASG
ncbi:MAG: enolase C-terminal domain-like protein [Pseudomonadota bacterium]